jgi:hypothetical protein
MANVPTTPVNRPHAIPIACSRQLGLSVYGEDEISPMLVSSSLVPLVSLDFLVVGGGDCKKRFGGTASWGRKKESELAAEVWDDLDEILGCS